MSLLAMTSRGRVLSPPLSGWLHRAATFCDRNVPAIDSRVSSWDLPLFFSTSGFFAGPPAPGLIERGLPYEIWTAIHRKLHSQSGL